MMYSQNSLFDYQRFDPIEIRNYNQQLYVGTILNPFLISMDLILNEKNVVFSDGIYLSTLNEYLETTFDLRESKYGELRTTLAAHNEGTLLHPVKRFSDNQNFTLYAYTIPGRGDSVVRGTVLCALDMRYLEYAIEQMTGEAMSVLLAFENNLISGDEQLWNGLQNHRLLLDRSKGVKIQRAQIKGAKYAVVLNSARGIDFVLAVRNRSYLVNVIIVFLGSLIFVGILVSGAYLFAGLITRKNYRPLRTLLGIIDSPDDSPQDIEDLDLEYSSIYKSYREMLHVSESQSMTIYEQQKAMLEYCWQVILERTHEINDNILDKIEEFYPISRFGLHFCSVVIEGSHTTAASDLAARINDVDGALCNVVHYSKFTCLINHVTDEQAREDVFELITEYFRNCADSRCGVGRSYPEIRTINKSYNEAMLIVNYRLSNTDSRVFFRRDYEQLMSTFYFSISQETRLANYLRNGDYDNAISIISELLEINMSMNPISPKAIQNLFFAIYLTAIRVCGEIGVEVEQQREPEDLLQSNLIDDISMVVYTYLQKLCGAIQKESNQNPHLADAIKSFIAENITNPNLSMQLVSDHIDRSVSYTSRFFNRLYNTSFIEYINRYRIDIAARMIRESKRSLKDISKDVGFSSDISFRRSFIRYKGVTAGKYRKIV